MLRLLIIFSMSQIPFNSLLRPFDFNLHLLVVRYAVYTMTNNDEEKHDDAAATANDNDNTDEEKYTHKIYIGRVPTKFTEDTVKRILIEKMMLAGTTGTGTTNSNSGSGNDTNIIEKVELIYPHDDDDNADGREKVPRSSKDKEDEIKKRNLDREHGIDVEHRGFGFIIFSTEKYRDDALKLQTIRGGRKVTSKKLYTMYLRPYVAITYDDDNNDNENGGGGEAEGGAITSSSDNATNNARDICYLWNLHRCPYGNECKFRHVGIGSCLKKDEDLTPDELKQIKRKRNGKCFLYKKKGKCEKGDECLYSHDFECVVPESEKKNDNTKKDNDKTNKSESTTKSKIPNSLKDCINWKTKGKCRKGDKCVYKHDLELQKIALEKKAIKTKQNASKKRKHDNEDDDEDGSNNKRSNNSNSNYQGGNNRKEKQPLCVRIFGLNYDTTENDIKEFIQSKLGSSNGNDDNSNNSKDQNQNQQHLIKSVLFPKFEDSNRSKGYCGIYFASPKAALDCVSKCDNEELHGRWLRVQTGKSMTIDEWDGLHNK
jgi:hypothetical protein